MPFPESSRTQSTLGMDGLGHLGHNDDEAFLHNTYLIVERAIC